MQIMVAKTENPMTSSGNVHEKYKFSAVKTCTFVARFLTLAAILVLALFPVRAWGAIGCTLNNPAQDLKYLFPEVTSFREEVRDFVRLPEGRTLFEGLKQRLGSDLDPVYETFDTPFTIYSVFKGSERIGIVHGVNVPGRGGVIQVFLSTHPVTGEIRDFFFQRLESPAAKALKDKAFRARFKGLSLADFYKHDYFAVADPANPADRLAGIRPPRLDASQAPDFDASLRGIRKNLILLDFFVYERKAEPFFERTRKLLSADRPASGTPAPGFAPSITPGTTSNPASDTASTSVPSPASAPAPR